MIENILDNAHCKVKDTHKNLHRWKNWEANTPFAPIFDVPLWIEDLNPWFLKEIVEVIKQKNPGSYRDTWQSYNIFTWEDEPIRFLKASIYRIYDDYMKELGLVPEQDLWIRGWAVNLGKNEGVPVHSHSYHENTYLSGNIMISSNPTTTDYAIPHLSTYYGFYRVENTPARMTLFPSWVQHKVDPIEDEERISIGFDIFTYFSMEYISKSNNVDALLNDPIMKAIPLVKSE